MNNTIHGPFLVIITGTNGPRGHHSAICGNYESAADFVNGSWFAKEHDSGTEAWVFMGNDHPVSATKLTLHFDGLKESELTFSGDEGNWTITLHSIPSLMAEVKDGFVDLQEL